MRRITRDPITGPIPLGSAEPRPSGPRPSRRSSGRRASGLALATVGALAVLFVGQPLAAQESTTRGFTIGLHAMGGSLTPDGQSSRNAPGGGLIVGYGVNRRVTIFAQTDAGEFEQATTGEIEGSWALAHFDLGVRYNFANSLRSYVPFLIGALGARAISVDNPIVDGTPRDLVSISGAAFTLGGGIDVYLSENWAVDLQVLLTGGEFTTIRIDNISQTGFDFKASSSRLNLGLQWWP